MRSAKRSTGPCTKIVSVALLGSVPTAAGLIGCPLMAPTRGRAVGLPLCLGRRDVDRSLPQHFFAYHRLFHCPFYQVLFPQEGTKSPQRAIYFAHALIIALTAGFGR